MPKFPSFSNTEIAEMLREIAVAYEALDENRFKIIAYKRAAETVAHHPIPIREVWEKGELKELEGIGPAMVMHLEELFTTGEVSHFKTVKEGFPEGMFTLLKVSGIGPKSAYKLATELNISTLGELREAFLSGAVADLEGFGEKSVEELLKSLDDVAKRSDRILLSEALEQAEALRKALIKLPGVLQVEYLGSLRRRLPTIGDIDLAVAVEGDADHVITAFTELPMVDRVLAAGKAKAMVLLASGVQADLRVQAPESYGAQLQYFTGSKYHNIALRSYALKRGKSLSGYGIKEVETGEIREYPDEKSFYNALDLDLIPPELREDRGEIEAARLKKLPQLISESDIKGDIHIHSDFNTSSPLDTGVDSLEKLLSVASKRGYEYIGLGDHSPRITNSTEDEIAKELSRRKSHFEKLLYSAEGPRVLIGLEVDIFSDGTLSLPDTLLNELDYAVVSIHGGHTQSRDQITGRILSALSHPKVKVLGHPTGRKLNKRPAYDADWEKVFRYCAQNSIFIEINSSPMRLDLPDELIFEARKYGVTFIINSDAHAASAMNNVKYGVSMARRGWLAKENVVNTLPLKGFLKKLAA